MRDPYGNFLGRDIRAYVHVLDHGIRHLLWRHAFQVRQVDLFFLLGFRRLVGGAEYLDNAFLFRLTGSFRCGRQRLILTEECLN